MYQLYRAYWQRRQNNNNNFSAVVPYDLEQQRKETREMLDDLTTRDQRMMFAVVTLVHLADSKEELDSDTDALQSTARKHLCQLATLNWQQADGLVTALPLGLRRIDALRTLTTEALAVLMPFKAQEVRDQGGVYYGQNVISKNLIIANRKELLNGNGFVLGVSGSGKSFTAKREMVNLALSTDDDIIVIDPESEYRPLIEGLGGEVIDISATSRSHINAMDMEQGYGDGENPVVLKSEFLLSLCEQLVGSGKLSAKEKSIIDRCTAQCYHEYIRGGYKGKAPTLQDFHAELLRQPEDEARDVALAIELFTEGSLNTFAKPTNVDTNSRIICYDIRDLGKQLLPVGITASPFGIFFADGSGDSDAVSPAAAVAQINREYADTLSSLQAGGSYDSVEIIGGPPSWVDVFAVFSVKTTTGDGLNVAVLDADRVDRLRAVFWDMTKITTAANTVEHPATPVSSAQ